MCRENYRYIVILILKDYTRLRLKNFNPYTQFTNLLNFILETVLDCIAAGSLNPISLYRCISDAIGIDSSCHDCICYVMEKFGIECNQDVVESIEDVNPTIEIIL